MRMAEMTERDSDHQLDELSKFFSPVSDVVVPPRLEQRPPFIPERADVMTLVLEYPPGFPGAPPHRHSGPVFGYMLDGEMLFELEGEPERVIKAGEAFWEPG